MSKNFILYGVIEEQTVWKSKDNYITEHNNEVIHSLPINDPWPPLSKEMFHITENSFPRTNGPLLNYKGRVIHFAANVKATEFPWKEWKDKIENLLEKLFWYQAFVHFKPWYDDLATFWWSIHSEKGFEYYRSSKLTPKALWLYKGDKQWDDE